MDIKDELKKYTEERLGNITSKMFLDRVLRTISDAPNNKDGLIEAAIKIRGMVVLFVSKKIGKEIFENLKLKIDKS